MKSTRILLTLLLFAAAARLHPSDAERATEERLSFQTNGPWSPRANLNADVAMVYGIGQRMPANIDTWRQHGYTVHVMTGVAWGQYQEYLNGQFRRAESLGSGPDAGRWQADPARRQPRHTVYFAG
jgi:hypothetical protein